MELTNEKIEKLKKELQRIDETIKKKKEEMQKTKSELIDLYIAYRETFREIRKKC
ncbi:MAG: hypothetical protein LBV03_02635 [Fusobacteriales bacterium]|jgi:predicted  nucleic acid-binding Zn-ribbon protein|nr:hypothetical protein [Fusobacteriales bacterium]